MRCDEQDEVIDFLSCGESYGLDGPVERVDTHAAIVFLAGERAYKLKRAVKLSYLDFSTAGKRKAVCEAELRLNRRTAPELYLEVRAVRRQANGKLGFGEGEPVDWVLVMRRFPPGALLEEVAERGELGRRLVRRLGDTIADFHAKAAIASDGDGAGRIRRVIEGNRRSMAALPPGAFDGDSCDEFRHVSLSALDDVAPLLDRRASEGRVRHCHGDLHLANICLWKGEPTLFDCLEFDAGLATIDVLYDLAFLLMDLWQRGLKDAASILFNRYCDMTGEAEGLAALPLFLSLRAAIRAHVCASAAERQPDERAKADKLAEGRRYLSDARSFLAPQPPLLVAIGGLSGTGKSTLAGTLVPHLGRAPGARWLRSDVMRKRMAGIAPEEKLPASAYSAESSRAVYDRLTEEARKVLAAGQAVIADAVFAAPGERAAIAAVAKEVGVPFTGIWLDAPRETLRRRVGARTGDASDADAAVLERQLSYDVGDLSSWYRLDASGKPEDIVAEAARLLGLEEA